MSSEPSSSQSKDKSFAEPENSEIAAAIGEAWKKLEEVGEVLTEIRSKEKEVVNSQSTLGANLIEAESKLRDFTAIASSALATKTQITDLQVVIATKSDHIESAQKHADKVRGEMDRALTAATKSVTDAEGLKERAQSASDSGAQFLAQLQTSKEKAESELVKILKDREGADEAAIATKALAEKSATIEQRVAGYETRLADLEAQSIAQLKTITELLPGATSAGLASAFDARRKTFLDPSQRWQWIFIGSIGLIVLLALTGLVQTLFGGVEKTYHDLFWCGFRGCLL